MYPQAVESWIAQVRKEHPITVFRDDDGTIHVMTDDKSATVPLTETAPPGAPIQIHLLLHCKDGRVIPFSSVKSESALSSWYGLG